MLAGHFSTKLKTQQLAYAVRLALADDEFQIISQRNEPPLAAHGAHLAYMVGVHNCISVNALETGVLEPRLEGRERMKGLIFLVRRDDPHNFAFRLECEHLGD